MNYFYALVLLFSCSVFANQSPTLDEILSPKMRYADKLDGDEEVEMVVCSKCKGFCKAYELVEFCDACGAKICSCCELTLAASNEIYLDKASDYFFIRTRCHNCGKEVILFASHRSYERMALLMGRVYDDSEEYVTLQDISQECSNLTY